MSSFKLAISTFDVILFMLKSLKISTSSIKNSLLNKIMKLHLDFMIIAVLIFELVIFQAMFIAFGLLFSYMYGLMTAVLMNPTETILNEATSINSYFKLFGYLNFRLMLMSNLCLVFTITYWSKRTLKTDYLREAGILNATCRLIFTNFKFRYQDFLVFSIVISIVASTIRYSGLFLVEYHNSILTVISALLLALYSNSGEEELVTKTRRFIIIQIVVMISVLSMAAMNKFDNLNAVGATILIVGFYLAIDRLITVYVEYRGLIMHGSDLSCVANYFDINDMKSLYYHLTKLDVNELKPIQIALIFMTANATENFVTEEVQKYHHSLLGNDELSDYERHQLLVNCAGYLYHNYSDICEVQNMFMEAKKTQEAEGFKGTKCFDIDQQIALCEMRKDNPDYHLALELLTKESASETYLLNIGECYYYIGDYENSEKVFSKLNLEIEQNTLANYYVAKIELAKERPNTEKIDVSINNLKRCNVPIEFIVELESSFKIV